MSIWTSVREYKIFPTMLGISMVAALLISGVLGLSDWIGSRENVTKALLYAMHGAANIGPLHEGAFETVAANEQFHELERQSGILSLCLYNGENQLLKSWSRVFSNYPCPAHVVRTHVEGSLKSVEISQKIESQEKYLGMIYAVGELEGLDSLIKRVALLFLILIGPILFSSSCASLVTVRRAAGSLNSIRGWLNILKNGTKDRSHPPAPKLSSDFDALTTDISDLKTYLEYISIPRQKMETIETWYKQALSHYMDATRSSSAEDPLLSAFTGDYEYLVSDNVTTRLIDSRIFNLPACLNRALSSAKGSFLISPRVHISVSIQSGMHEEWVGDPKIMEALIRNLLLISIRRTTFGLISLRLDIAEQNYSANDKGMLRISLEDSGPPIQGPKLQEWYGLADGQHSNFIEEYGISWTLTGHLLNRLGAFVKAESNSSKGLSVTCSLPISSALQATQPEPIQAEYVLEQSWNTGLKPLILLVEPRGLEHGLSQLLKKSGYRVFVTDTHEGVIAWAPTMPFSAIILDATQADGKIPVLKALRDLIELGLMEELPIYTILSGTDHYQHGAWKKAGAKELITLPLEPRKLQKLFSFLKASPANFYLFFDKHLRADLPQPIKCRLPQLNADFAVVLHEVKNRINLLSNSTNVDDLPTTAHAAKSVALSLGYFRIAALMSEIEHLSRQNNYADMKDNWSVIRDCLKTSGFENKCINVTIPVKNYPIFSNITECI